MFFFKNHAQNEAVRLVPDLFLFFWKALYKIKANSLHLVSITFHSPQLRKQLKQTVYNFRILTQGYTQFWFLRKGPGNSFSITLCMWYFRKNVSHVILFESTKIHCLIAFTSWDTGKYVYCNCLSSKLWHLRFWN